MITLFQTLQSDAENLTREVFERLTNSAEITDLAEKIGNADKETRGKLKKMLPAVTWQAHFDVGSHRSNDNAHPNGLFMLDFDHIENPFSFYNNILRKIRENEIWNGSLMAAHLTPSRQGLRLVVKADKRFKTIADNQHAFVQENQLSGLDECTKDLARLSFLVPFTYFYYLDYNIFTYEENCIEKDCKESAESVAADNAEPLDERKLKGLEKKRAEFLEKEFKGIKYGIIVDNLVQATGGEPVEGERNVRLYDLARQLRYIVDFDEDKLFCLLPSFGLPLNEVKSVASSALKGQRTGKTPYKLWKIIENLKKMNEQANESEEIETVAEEEASLPVLPPVFKEFVNIAPESFKVPTIMALLPIIGTLCSRLRANYIDGETHSPSFMVVIEAPQASGKSFTRKLENLCMQRIHSLDESAHIKEQAYQELLRQKKNSKEQPEEPQVIIRNIPASVSIAKLLKRLDRANGLHLFSFCEEIDTLTKSNKSGAWSQKSDIYRNAFDNAVYGQDYMSDISYSASVPVFYNLLLCGTPHAITRFFSDPEDGLVSRVVFCQLEDQFGAEMPKWKKLPKKSIEKITNLCRSLDERCNISKNEIIMNEHHIDLSFVNKKLSKWLDAKRLEALKNDDYALDIFRRRASVIGFRAAMLAYYLWDEKDNKNIKNSVCDFALFVANSVLMQQVYRYGEKMQSLRIFNNDKVVNHDSIFSTLEEYFTSYDVSALLAKSKRATPARVVISKWKKVGLIDKIGKNKFKKL